MTNKNSLKDKITNTDSLRTYVLIEYDKPELWKDKTGISHSNIEERGPWTITSPYAKEFLPDNYKDLNKIQLISRFINHGNRIINYKKMKYLHGDVDDKIKAKTTLFLVNGSKRREGWIRFTGIPSPDEHNSLESWTSKFIYKILSNPH